MKSQNMSPFLFVSDLDNTLIGDDTALKSLNQYLASHRQQFNSKIVYETGRSLYLYRLLAQVKSLLAPDVLITSVGTEMYFNPDQDIFDLEWAAALDQGWNREEIVDIASNFAELQFQPKSEQNPYKISYYLAQAVVDEILPKLKASLLARGYEIRLIYSAGQDLDLLPQNSTKGLAVQFLRRKWDIAATGTIVCGDSGNDISMFTGAEKGIIVGNAKPELLQWYEKNKNETLYLARSGYAAGIIEGLKHFNYFDF